MINRQWTSASRWPGAETGPSGSSASWSAGGTGCFPAWARSRPAAPEPAPLSPGSPAGRPRPIDTGWGDASITWLSGRQAETHRYWLGRRQQVTRNFQWEGLLPGRRLTPHEPIYRDTLRHALEEGGLDRIRALPFPVLILTAGLPAWLPAPLASALGMAAYSVEREMNRGRLHPGSGRRLGFRPVVVDARSSETPDDLVDLILASSATPPFTRIGRHRGTRLLDGGMVDNAPAFVADAVPGVRRNLVLLTRPYPDVSVGLRGSRLYLCPTEPVPINRWDYTRLERVEATLELGKRDAERHGAAILRFLD